MQIPQGTACVRKLLNRNARASHHQSLTRDPFGLLGDNGDRACKANLFQDMCGMSAALPGANYHHVGVSLRFQHCGSVFGSNADDHPIVMRFELDLAGEA